MPDLIIRDSDESDIPAIAAIYGQAVREGLASFELEAPSEAEMLKRRASLLDGWFPYLVAEHEGKVVGYAYAGFYRLRPAYRFCVENSVYVAPNLQRGGVGKALLKELIARCEALGYRQMIAVIGDSANLASIGLHSSLGFRKVGTLGAVGWKHGQWVDSVLMQRHLGDGDHSPPRDKD